MATFFDTHAHLDFPDFEADLPEIVARARAAGIERIVSIGTDLDSSARAVALAERFPEVHAAVGWHPGHAEDAPDDFRAELRALAAHPKVVAIGECGFDYYRLPSANGGTPDADARIKAKQAVVFRQQLEVPPRSASTSWSTRAADRSATPWRRWSRSRRRSAACSIASSARLTRCGAWSRWARG